MKLIEISKRSVKNREPIFVKVDDEDFEYLNKYTWALTYNRAGNKYATCHDRNKKTASGKYSAKIKMHRLILNLTDPKVLCDHRDGDGLNNQKHNLRECNRAENARNKNANKIGTSKYLGVFAHKNKYGPKWCAKITVNNKGIYLGIYTCEIEAAKSYDVAAKKHFGEFAHINIK